VRERRDHPGQHDREAQRQAQARFEVHPREYTAETSNC
jgi:hypothetical protein